MSQNYVTQTSRIHQLIYQRRVLAMMGVELWIENELELVSIEDLEHDHNIQVQTQVCSEVATSRFSNSEDDDGINSTAGSDIYLSEALTTNEVETPFIPVQARELEHQPNQYLAMGNEIGGENQYSGQTVDFFNGNYQSETDETQTTGVSVSAQRDKELEHSVDKSVIHQPFESITQKSLDDAMHLSEFKAPVFTMIGARFRNWVIMVTAEGIKDTPHAKLWQHMIQSLSLNIEQLTFPICEGINDIDSANASLAGFMFRLSQSDTAKLAMLTPLPQGIYYHQHVTTPTLSAMLSEPMQKKRLWQMLSAS